MEQLTAAWCNKKLFFPRDKRSYRGSEDPGEEAWRTGVSGAGKHAIHLSQMEAAQEIYPQDIANQQLGMR